MIFSERGEMKERDVLLGELPVILYGVLYLYIIIYAPDKKVAGFLRV